jgi:sugar/nucleoside kinase (ribokinase family)
MFNLLSLDFTGLFESKVFALNFSAPFIPQFFGIQLQQILPYCDIIIGNESEGEAWASANGLADKKNVQAVANAIAALPKANPSRPRIVVITQGAESTILANSAEPEGTKTFPVNALKDEGIVDTNAAGDAFAGGFLGAYVSGKSLDECVEVGHKLGQMCVGQVRLISSFLANDLNRSSRQTDRPPVQVAQGANIVGAVWYLTNLLRAGGRGPAHS